MNILLVDDDTFVYSALQLICRKKDWNLVLSDYSIDQYKNNNFDFVIIDFSPEKNFKLFSQILKEKVNQKILIISKDLECKSDISCELCSVEFSKKRLLKPFEIGELIDTIENFEEIPCKYSHTNCFENIDEILIDIIQGFNSYEYDKEKKLIYAKKNQTYSTVLSDLLNIVQILNEHHIKFKTLNEKDIQIV